MSEHRVPANNSKLIPKDEDQHDKPCKGCPFSRNVMPNHLDPEGVKNNGCSPLGGSPAVNYIAQALTPHYLPCHMRHDYTSLQDRLNNHNPDCAGAAIFRSNCGVANAIPPQLLHLPADTAAVFGTIYEFYSHHQGVSIATAEQVLDERTIDFIKKGAFAIGIVKSHTGQATFDVYKKD
jgi:hypothetical protein